MTAPEFSPPAADLRARQKLVLVALHSLEPTTAGDLAEHLAMNRPSVNNALHKIMDVGLVERTPRVVDGSQEYVWRTIHDT